MSGKIGKRLKIALFETDVLDNLYYISISIFPEKSLLCLAEYHNAQFSASPCLIDTSVWSEGDPKCIFFTFDGEYL